MCSFCATSFAAESVVSIDVLFMMSTGARGPGWVDREAQFAADAEEERKRGEAMFGAAAGHCSERVWRVGGEDAGKEVKVFVFGFEDMVISAVAMAVECFLGGRVPMG